MRYPERERRRIAAVRSRHPELVEPLSFLERIADAAGRFMPEVRDPPLSKPVAESPPLQPCRFPLNETAAAQAFITFLDALVESTDSRDAESVRDAVTKGRLDPVHLVRAYCAGDAQVFESEANELGGTEPELLASLAELAVKPQFIAAASALRKPADEVPARTDRCPACGSHPELALVTDAEDAEGVMLAVCPLCESEWPVSRVRCLFCGNEDDETLSYVRVEGEEQARVNVCDRCQSYLPIIDVRGRLEFAPAVERAMLAHLDILAYSRGWRRLSDGAPSVRRTQWPATLFTA
jgi:FdhE protein